VKSNVPHTATNGWRSGAVRGGDGGWSGSVVTNPGGPGTGRRAGDVGEGIQLSHPYREGEGEAEGEEWIWTGQGAVIDVRLLKTW
jgi:hypothetical protein